MPDAPTLAPGVLRFTVAFEWVYEQGSKGEPYRATAVVYAAGPISEQTVFAQARKERFGRHIFVLSERIVSVDTTPAPSPDAA